MAFETKYILPTNFILAACLLFVSPLRVYAQIKPDKSLGDESTKVTKHESKPLISGGAKRGHALFHSFKSFNIRKNQAAYFTSVPGVRNIISRVTGGSISRINGTLGVEGNANLFFINPNGIIFGKSASLDLSGSFIASTADTVDFRTFSFSAHGSSGVPQISLNRPMGLSFKGNQPPASIVVRGNGHNITQLDNILTPNRGSGDSDSGLRLSRGSISLIGEKVILDGGLITANSGSINIASIESGRVNFSSSLKKLFLNNVVFGDIILKHQALVDVSGDYGNGVVNLFGNDITLKDASLIINSNYSNHNGGSINIYADKNLTVLGPSKSTEYISDNRYFSRGIISQTFDGKGASINVRAGNLTVDGSSAIIAATFGSGDGGNVNLRAENIEIGGTSKYGVSGLGSVVLTTTASSGNTGKITVDATELVVRDGGFLISASFGEGDGETVDLDVNEILITGGLELLARDAFVPSSIASITTSSGDAGILKIKSDSLYIQDGARLDSSTLASGDAGSLFINTKDLVVSGTSSTINGKKDPSVINVSGSQINDFLGGVFQINKDLTGDAGSIDIKAENITIINGGEVTVGNAGTGDSGTLSIDSEVLKMQKGIITASTNEGDGGKVFINSDLIAGDFDSYIIANSREGEGGTINITSQYLLFPLGNISASSSLGSSFEGKVQVNSTQDEFNFAIVDSIEPVIGATPISCNNLQTSDKASMKNDYGELPEQTKSMANEMPSQLHNLPMYIDLKTKKTIPIQDEMSGWKENGDGTASPISFNSQNNRIDFASEDPCYQAYQQTK